MKLCSRIKKRLEGFLDERDPSLYYNVTIFNDGSHGVAIRSDRDRRIKYEYWHSVEYDCTGKTPAEVGAYVVGELLCRPPYPEQPKVAGFRKTQG